MGIAAIDLAKVRAPSVVERWYVLTLMCLIYAVNIADRYVVSTVLEPIRLELHLGDTGVAFLTGVPLALFYVTLGIPISLLADRANRRNILAACLIIWSGFTAACGLSRNYLQFLLGRIGVGTGEAGGTPTSCALLADFFPADRRPMAFTILALGAPIGAWLGADMAGAVAHAYGWRSAFLALGVPGLMLGFIVLLTVREPARGRLDGIEKEQRASIPESLRFLWRQKAAFHSIMGAGVCALWGWGLIWWTPTFLMRTYNLNVGEAGAVTGHIHLVGGVIASLGTAWLLGRPFMVDPRRVCWVLTGGVALATIPSFIAFWTHSLPLAKAMFWIFIPAIYFYIGPCMALVQNLAACHMRSVFAAWSGLCGNVFNLIIAPQVVGFLSDWYAGGHATDAASLRFGLLVLAPTGFWAAWHLYMTGRTVVEDQKTAENYAGPGG
ncbi:MAG TPA: MFS transporter [Steroidobacteraceae bacterium]|nr:MFS transporter [Steroidobacteraceae bacterium]